MIAIDAIQALSSRLLETADHYAAADPDAPAWEAEERAHRILALIATLTPLGQDAQRPERTLEPTER
jgi:hypothetical protein